MAWVPWHLGSAEGSRAALSIGWASCLLLGPCQKKSTVTPALDPAFTPIPCDLTPPTCQSVFTCLLLSSRLDF